MSEPFLRLRNTKYIYPTGGAQPSRKAECLLWPLAISYRRWPSLADRFFCVSKRPPRKSHGLPKGNNGPFTTGRWTRPGVSAEDACWTVQYLCHAGADFAGEGGWEPETGLYQDMI